MPIRPNRFLAAAAYLSTFALSFLPGLGLWFWAKDRDSWLAAHGRSATLFNLTVMAGYLVLAPFAQVMGLLATCVRIVSFWTAHGAARHGVAYAVWGPHYLTGLFTTLASLCCLLLWVGAIIFNIVSAWRAGRGLGPWWLGGSAPGASPQWFNRREDQPSTTKTPMSETSHRKLHQSIIALALYMAASGLLLLPAIRFDFRHVLIASAVTDPSIYLWGLAWWPWAITHGLNPFYSHVIWSPPGQNLIWGLTIPSLALLLAPVTHIWGPLAGYNLIALLSPVLGAWTTYLLCRHITVRFWPALFGGWIFGFSSYEFTHLQLHMALFVTVAFPLAVWIYLLRRDGKLTRWWYIGWLALLTVFQFGISTELLATAVPLGLLAALLAAVLPVNVTVRHRYRQYLGDTLIGLVLAGVILLPCFYYLFFVRYVHGIFALPSIVSTDPMSLLIPTPITFLGGQLATPISAHFVGDVLDQGGYFGVPLLAMVWLFNREFVPRTGAQILLIMLALIVILSFGPQLQLAPSTTSITPVILPWAVMAHLPLFDKVLPSRLIVYAWLAAAVIGAWWLAVSRTGRGWKLLLAGLTVVALLPNISAGYWAYKPDNPPFFISSAAARYLPRGANVVVLPYGYTGYSMLWQAETHFYFSMAGGYVNPTRPPPFSTFPAVAAFYDGGATAADYPAQLQRFIKAFKIRAFIVVADDRRAFASLVAPLHIKPIHTGGVWLYLLKFDPAARKRD